MANKDWFDIKVSPSAAIALAVGCTVGWGAFVMPGTTFLPQAGPVGTIIALLIGASLMAVIAVSLIYLLKRTSGNGGGYAYTKATFGRLHAYICGWSLLAAYLVIIPANAMALIVLTRILRVDVLQQGPSYVVFGNELHLLELLFVALVLGAFALLTTYAGQKAITLQKVLVTGMLGGVIIITIAALVNPEARAACLEPPFSPDMTPLVGTVAVASTIPWMFIGFGSVTQVAENLSFSPAKAGRTIILALVVGAAVYLILNTVAAVTPATYEDWHDYVAYAPRLSGVYAYPVFLAAQQLMGSPGLAVACVAFVCAVLSCILGFFLVTSKLLVAMARSGVLSDWLGELSPETHRPRHATFFIFVVALVATTLGNVTLSWIISLSALGASVSFLYSCAAARKIARDEGSRPYAIIATVGILISCIFLVVLLAPIPGLRSTVEWESYLFIIAWVALGFNFYTPRVPHHTPDEPIAIARLS